MSDMLVQNASVLQVPKDARWASLLPEHDVLICGNRIEAVQPSGQANASHFRTVIDAASRLVMPGLINTHAHVPMVIFRGLAEDVTIDKWFNDYIWPLESNLQPDNVYWGMQLGLAEMIRGGITSVADHYFHMDEGAKAVERAGIRALLGWGIFGSQGMPAIEQSSTFIQEWQHGAHGRIRTCMAPHAPYTCDDAFLNACALKAAKLGVAIHIHVAETASQTAASLQKRGKTPVQIIEDCGILDQPTILAHVCGALPEDIDIIAIHPCGIAHAPKTYLKLAMNIAPVTAFRAAGIPVGLATDGAVSSNTLDIWEALRLLAMLQKDRAGTPEIMPISEALHVATRESARVIGLPDDLGSIEPGYLADLIVVDLSGLHHQPLHNATASIVYNMQPADVHSVIVDGQVIMRDRQLLTLDPGEIVTQVNLSMSRLAQRVPGNRIQSYAP